MNKVSSQLIVFHVLRTCSDLDE